MSAMSLPRLLSKPNESRNSDEPESERLYLEVARSLFEWSGLGLASLDPAHRLVQANDEFFRHFGGSFPERKSQSFYRVLHPTSREKIRRQFSKLAQIGQSHFTEQFIGIGPRNGVFSGLLRAVAVRRSGGPLNAVVVMVRPDEVVQIGSVRSRDKAMDDLDARILEGVAAGATNVQLASRLHLSRQGIEYRIATMLRRYKVPNRPALVSRAYTMGLLGLDSWPPRVLTRVDKAP